ncbi:MAG: hypothetical protein M5U26_02955 [Planctomycetota bacterium]|nr:hypothetical protein [Planctomycetota bacterium]
MSDRNSVFPVVLFLLVCLGLGGAAMGLFVFKNSTEAREAEVRAMEEAMEAEYERQRSQDFAAVPTAVPVTEAPPPPKPEEVPTPTGEAEAEPEPTSGTRALWVPYDSDLKELNRLLRDGWRVQQMTVLPGNADGGYKGEARALVILEKP